MEESSTPVLAYWAIRGLAQPIRLLLAYAEVAYEDLKYQVHPSLSTSLTFLLPFVVILMTALLHRSLPRRV